MNPAFYDLRSEGKSSETGLDGLVDPKGNGSYSSVDVEIIHKVYSGEV